MIDITKLEFTISQMLKADRFILLKISEKTVYENGKATERKNPTLTITSVESLFEKIEVRLEKCNIDISNDALEKRTKDLNFVYVVFSGDSVKLYKDFNSGETRATARASSVSLADDIGIDLE